jgi:hypothetical protein
MFDKKKLGDACASPFCSLEKKSYFFFFFAAFFAVLAFFLVAIFFYSPFPLVVEHCDITSSQFVLCIESTK